MTTIRLRPTFSIGLEDATDAVMNRIESAVKNQPEEIAGQFRAGHAMISIVESKRHFWSPWLHLDIRDGDNESEKQLVGRFSPHPSIWTAFMFTYLSLAVLSFFSLVIGYSQQLAGQGSWATGEGGHFFRQRFSRVAARGGSCASRLHRFS